ncbi:hypothetical protein TGAM01_v210219 [Trichoderma gamsii]|uniref:Uncharacterized protein n=1 Tax=Trichoderma gamsii TaxID=398673 RepID=A0A2P4Z9E5_9HYPO|nr:hypothetical protein TGAM01_v210219 [Trichoderma gamsii]PON20934.1 hypothetical protein TGAM01_v210219 [Trichoderma gamsii]
MFRFLQPQRRGIGFQSLGLVAADCGKGSKDGRAQNKLSHEKKDRALVAVSSEGIVTHASQPKKRRSCSPTGTPAFGTEYQRSPPRKSFGSRTPPRVASHLVCSNCLLLPPGAAQFSRIEIGDRRRRVFDASPVSTKYRSTSTKLLPAKHSGGHLRLASPAWRPSQMQPVLAIPWASREPVGATEAKVRGSSS